MAKKRTKKQKQSTSLKRIQSNSGEAPLYSLADTEIEEVTTRKSIKKNKTISNETTFEYDPQLLIKDLRKTVFLSSAVFVFLIGLFWVINSGMITL